MRAHYKTAISHSLLALRIDVRRTRTLVYLDADLAGSALAGHLPRDRLRLDYGDVVETSAGRISVPHDDVLGADGHGMRPDVHPVDELFPKQRLDQRAAAPDDHVRAILRLQPAERGGHVARHHLRVHPVGLEV